MADMKVRNLPDWLVECYGREAAREGVSLEESLRRALQDIPRLRGMALARRLDGLAFKIRKDAGVLPDSTPLIREVREEMEEKGDVGHRRERSRQVARAGRKTA